MVKDGSGRENDICKGRKIRQKWQNFCCGRSKGLMGEGRGLTRDKKWIEMEWGAQSEELLCHELTVNWPSPRAPCETYWVGSMTTATHN